VVDIAAMTPSLNVDVLSISPDDIPAMLGAIATLQAQLMIRLAHASAPASQSNEGDKLLTVDEAAGRLSVTNEWLYRRGKRLGLAVKLGDGTLRFSRLALDAYIKSQTISGVPARRRRAA
jgi:hypothetical protein